jgi:hypothetical protein
LWFWLTIDPRITDKHSALGKLQLGDFGFDTLVFQCNLLNGDNFTSIGVAVNTGSKTNVALNFSKAQADDSFVKFVLSDY